MVRFSRLLRMHLQWEFCFEFRRRRVHPLRGILLDAHGLQRGMDRVRVHGRVGDKFELGHLLFVLVVGVHKIRLHADSAPDSCPD